jgi:hypothetical protein
MRERFQYLELLREEHRFELFLASLKLLEMLDREFFLEKEKVMETQERLSWNYDY